MNGMKCERNQKGYTLIELIVTMAIMLILTGAVITGVSMLGKGNAKKSSKMFVTVINELRGKTLSISDSLTAEVYKKESEYTADIIKGGEVADTYKLGSRIRITFDGHEISADNRLVIKFEQRTGKIASVEVNGTSVMEGVTGEILISSNGGTKEYTLTLYYLTGKIETDY